MWGRAHRLFLAAAAVVAAVGVQADFMVYTEPPLPTTAIPSFANPAEAASWTTSVFLNARLAYGRFTSSLGAPYQASLTSARAEIEAFVRTAAHNYSVPAAVTVATETPTYYAQPAWYTALPSGARAFKEQQVADQFRIVQSVIRGRQATSSSSSSSNAAGAAAPTPRLHEWAGSKEFGVLAGVAVAAFL